MYKSFLGYLSLLSQLTSSPKLTKEEYLDQLMRMSEKSKCKPLQHNRFLLSYHRH